MVFWDGGNSSLTLKKATYLQKFGAVRVVYFFPLVSPPFPHALVQGLSLILDPVTGVAVESLSSSIIISTFILGRLLIRIYSTLSLESCALTVALLLIFLALISTFLSRSIDLIEDLSFFTADFHPCTMLT